MNKFIKKCGKILLGIGAVVGIFLKFFNKKSPLKPVPERPDVEKKLQEDSKLEDKKNEAVNEIRNANISTKLSRFNSILKRSSSGDETSEDE